MIRRAVSVLAAVPLVLLGACTTGPGPSPGSAPSTSPALASAGPGTADPATAGPVAVDPAPEPTTTNTLPAPPPPSDPAPSTAGVLTADALPVPTGWSTVVREGGTEEGFQGNGTWVHARDPRYAAQDAITIGCADVTRDDYPDPVAALEGNYTDDDGAPGVALALEFLDEAAAAAYWRQYTAQVEACRTPGGPVQTELVEGLPGLLDRRTYPDGDWTEVGRRAGTRITLVILSDEGHRISEAEARALLEQLA